MNYWMIIEYIFCVGDVFLIFYFIDKFFIRRKINNKQIFLIIFLQALIHHGVNQVFGLKEFLGSLIMIAFMGILFKRIFRERLLNIYLLIIFGVIVLICIIEISVDILIMVITNTDIIIILENNTYRVIVYFVTKGIAFILVKKCTIKIINIMIKYFKKTQIYKLSLVLLLNMIAFFLVVYFYRNLNTIRGDEKKYVFIIGIAVIVFTILLLKIIKKIVEHAVMEAQWYDKEIRYKRQIFHTENMNHMINNLKAQRHDFNNHIGCIYGLINMSKFQETKEYIEKLTKETNEYNEIINTNNPILASLLNMKIAKAKKEKIKVDINIDIDKDIDIEYIDMSIILGNILDNAIEGCQEIVEDQRYIEIDISLKMNNLIIKVINSKSDKIHLEVKTCNKKFTTKKDTENHGFGLRNVLQIVEKYRGIVKMEDKISTFIVNIAIPI